MKKRRIVFVSILIFGVLFFSACGYNKDSENLEKDENSYESYFNSGVSYMDDREFEKAIQAFTSAIDLNGNDALAYANRAECFSQIAASMDAEGKAEETRSRYQDAGADYKKAIQLDPENTAYYSKLADVFLQLKDRDAAMDILTSGLTKTSDQGISDRKDELNNLIMKEAIENSFWKMPWDEIEEYLFLCSDGQALTVSVSDTISFSKGVPQYQIQDDMVIMHLEEDEYSSRDFVWKWDPENEEFVIATDFPEENVGKRVLSIESLTLFQDLALRQDYEQTDDSGWQTLLDLLMIYYQFSQRNSDFQVIEQKQEEWIVKNNQRIAEEAIDISTESGNHWMQYQYKKRIFELLRLPMEDSEEPVYEPPAQSDDNENAAISAEDIAGTWELNIEKTQEAMGDEYIYEIFGSGLRQFGSGMTISADGMIDYGFAISRGGKGHFEIDGNCINITIDESYESNESNHGQQMRIEYNESGDIVLVLTYLEAGTTKYDLFWERI